jgi:hypothetical protein
MSETNAAPIAQQISNNINNVGKNLGETTQQLGESFSNVRDNVSASVQNFSENVSQNSSKDFLNSNGIIAKFVFLILILIVCLIIMKVGIAFITNALQPSSSPYLIQGINQGNNSLQITQDPAKAGSIQILRSNNRSTGMEFTWSVWLLINSLNTDKSYQHVFSKGGNGTFDTTTGIMKVNNAPGVYLKQESDGTCTLHIVMNTASSVPTTDITTISESVDVNVIPMKEWVNVMIRLQNKIMDIYVNGTITKRLVFTNVPLQNYDDIWVCQNNGKGTGFSGQLSNLRYFNRALNIFEINNIVSAGPNLYTSTGPTFVQNYLSSSWYTSLNS